MGSKEYKAGLKIQPKVCLEYYFLDFFVVANKIILELVDRKWPQNGQNTDVNLAKNGRFFGPIFNF